MVEKLDAVALLKADHRKVEELFRQFEAAKGDGKKKALVAFGVATLVRRRYIPRFSCG